MAQIQNRIRWAVLFSNDVVEFEQRSRFGSLNTDGTGNALGGATNASLELPGVGVGQTGAYSVVVSNVMEAVTSAPAMLSGIPPALRRRQASPRFKHRSYRRNRRSRPSPPNAKKPEASNMTEAGSGTAVN